MNAPCNGRGFARRTLVPAAIAGCAALAVGQFSGAALAQGSPIVIRAISTWEKPIVFNKPLLDLIERVGKNSGGRLRIEWVGGPEAVPIFQGTDAVSKGIFDLINTSPSFFAASVPEANALYLREDLSVRGLYSSGIVKALDEITREKIGVAFIGVPMGGVGLTFFTRQQPQNMDFFKGKKIRVTPLYVAFVRALGSSTVNIAPAEVYQSLERGVVDGVGWPLLGIVERKFPEVAKYMVLPSYYDVRCSFLMNARVFDRLPADLRKILLESIRESEEWGHNMTRRESAAEIEQIKKEGIVTVNLPAAEAKKYLQLANDALWEQIIKDSPKHGPRLKEIFSKAKN